MIKKVNSLLRLLGLMLLLFAGIHTFAADKDFPEKPAILHAVNDLAHMMSESEVAQLEQKLREYERATSTEITIVTVTNIGDYDISDYAITLGKKWQLGKAGKDNGVLIIAAKENRKGWIAVGKGLEGTLTDLTAGRIYRNEMVPSFKAGNYYEGFSKTADAVIAVTKGEYKADDKEARGGHLPVTAIIILVIFIIIILRIFRGGGGGNYMSGRGFGGFATGWFLGSMLGGRGGDWGGGGGDSGFGGFGGGGDFGGGGAGGSW